MAEAKITIKTYLDNEKFKELSAELGEGTAKLSEYRKSVRELTKAQKTLGTVTAEDKAALDSLHAKIQATKRLNSEYSKELKKVSKELANAAKASGDFSSAAKSMWDGVKDATSKQVGFDVAGISASATKLTLLGAAAATAVKTLVEAGRSISAFSNQFITFAGSAKGATDMYNKFNEVYRATNYDEQAVYDLAKGFLSVGKNAEESAELIKICADTSAHFGQGIEMTEMLADCFKRLATDGELTERQYKALAEAGIDLSDVQEQIRTGGETAYEALRDKLLEYQGGMDATKRTAEEMEGDIKGNLIEIGRQTALLIDEFFGFSDMLKSFYQWVIDSTQAAIESIRSMVKHLREAKASAEDYRLAMEAYGEIDENDIEAVTKRAMYVDQQCRAMKAERQEAEELAAAYNKLSSAKKVHSIAKASGSASSSDGSQSAKTVRDDSKRVAQEEERKYQSMLKETEQLKNSIYGADDKRIKLAREMSMIGKSEYARLKAEKQWALEDAARQMAAENEAYNLRIQHLAALKNYYDENAGLPGAAKTLDAIEEQKEKEKELHELRLANIDAERDKRIAANNEILSELGVNADPGSNVSGDTFSGLSQGLDMAKAALKAMGVEMTSLQQLAVNTFGKGFASAFENIISGAKSVKQAFSDMVKQMLIQCLNLMAQWAAVFALVSTFSGPKVGAAAANKAVLALASGGYVSGPGTGTSDSIPAMLSNGEYVLNSRAVDRLGTGYLDALNAGTNPVTDMQTASSSASSAGGTVVLNVSALDAQSFTDMLARGGLKSIKQALFEDARGFGSEVEVW